MLRYTLLRLLVFLGALALLWLLGLRGEEDLLLLVVGAALLSMVVSFFALRRFREDTSARIAERLDARAAARQARPAHTGADEEAEDAEVARGTGDASPPRDDEGDFR